MRTFYDGIILGYWKAYDSFSKQKNSTTTDAFMQVRHDFIDIAKEAANDPFMTKESYIDICSRLLLVYKKIFGSEEDTFYTVLKRDIVVLGVKLEDNKI